MTDFNLIISSLVLAILLPVSVAVLYALMASHVQLAPESAMHSAVLERFDSALECAQYHAANEAERGLRIEAVMTRYRQEMERRLDLIDPRQAEPYRHALAATATWRPEADVAHEETRDEVSLSGATKPEVTATTPHANGTGGRRPALRRAHLTALRQ